ncbi:hypothetical protein BKA81DRAFT_59250 [Phyllosticta paracitricarpa]
MEGEGQRERERGRKYVVTNSFSLSTLTSTPHASKTTPIHEHEDASSGVQSSPVRPRLSVPPLDAPHRILLLAVAVAVACVSLARVVRIPELKPPCPPSRHQPASQPASQPAIAYLPTGPAHWKRAQHTIVHLHTGRVCIWARRAELSRLEHLVPDVVTAPPAVVCRLTDTGTYLDAYVCM